MDVRFSDVTVDKTNGIQIRNPKSYQLGNLKFHATKELIYKTQFPAMSLYWLKTYCYYNVFPQVSENGFIQKKLTEKEKMELKKSSMIWKIPSLDYFKFSLSLNIIF
jgi:hypothetical protein